MPKLAKIQLASILFLIDASACIASRPIDPDSGYSALSAIERSTYLSENDRLEAMVRSYEGNFREHLTLTNLKSIDNRGLDFILRSIYTVAFYTFNPTYLEDASLVMQELESRGAATNNQKTLFHKILVGYRKFEEARNYSKDNPHLETEPVPWIGENNGDAAGGPLVYRVSKDRHELIPTNVESYGNDILLVITHPLCSFSRNAMAAIENDSSILDAIGDRVVWMTPASTRLNFNEIQEWNREHLSIEIVIAHTHQDWPMVDSWATPQFFLLRNGTVLDSFSGWPTGGSRDRLVELLRRGGMLPGS
jgi:hypothetical protein